MLKAASDTTTWFVQEVFVHNARLQRFLAHLRVLPHDIPDVCQEAYMRLLTLHPPDRPRNPQRYLFTVAQNVWCDMRRRRLVVRMEQTHDFDVHDAARDYIDPERQVSGQREWAAFNHAVASLPAKQRQVYWLKRVDDLSIKEIAYRLRISQNTVEQHITVAQRVLRSRGVKIAPRVRSTRDALPCA